MPGSVDQVDDVAVPPERCGSGLNRYPTLAFLVHEVHGRIPIMNLADAHRCTSVEQHALCHCGFSSIYVCYDSEVPYRF